MKYLILAIVLSSCAASADRYQSRKLLDDLCWRAIERNDTTTLRLLDTVRLRINYWEYKD